MIPSYRKTLQSLLLAGLLLWLPALVRAAEPLTLDSCLQLARQNNRTLRSANLEVEKAKLVKQQAFTKYFPQVQATGAAYASIDPWVSISLDDIGNSNVRTILNLLYEGFGESLGLKKSLDYVQNGYLAGVVAVQPVYMGGKIVAGNKLAKVGVKAAELQQQVEERDLLLEVEESYWLCVRLQQQQHTIEAALQMLDTVHQNVTTAISAGLALPADLLKVELKQQDVATQAMQLRSGIRLASRALCQGIGLEPSDSLLLSDEMGAATERVAAMRPESRLLDLQVEAARLRQRMDLADALPHVVAGASYAYNKVFDDPAANGIAFVSVSVPLTSWWETSYKMKQHRLNISQAEDQRANLNEKMQLQEQQVRDQFEEARMLVEQQTRLVSTAEESYRLTTLNYEAGMATLSALLEAHTDVLKARTNLLSAQLSLRINTRRYEELRTH